MATPTGDYNTYWDDLVSDPVTGEHSDPKF